MLLDKYIKLDSPGVVMLIEVLILVHLLAFLTYIILLTRSFTQDKNKKVRDQIKKLSNKNDWVLLFTKIIDLNLLVFMNIYIYIYIVQV